MKPITDSEPVEPGVPSDDAASLPDNARAALRRACAIAGGQKSLARRIGASQSRVWYWLEKSCHGVAAPFVLAIEAATGVPRHALRPDIYPAAAPEPRHDHQEVRDEELP